MKYPQLGVFKNKFGIVVAINQEVHVFNEQKYIG